MRRLCILLGVTIGCGSGGGVGSDANGSDDDSGSGSGVHMVKVTLNNRPMNPTMYSFLVAFQDGSSAWRLAPAPSGDTYALPINAPSWGVAYTCIANVPGTTTQARSVTSAHFAVAERTELTFDVPGRCSDRAPTNVTLSGTISNRPATGYLVVQFGARNVIVGSQSGGFTLQTPPGTHDLVVLHVVSEGNGDYYPDSALVVRNLAVTSTTTRALDYADASAMQNFPVTVSVPSLSARVVAQTILYTANGTQLTLVRETNGWESDVLGKTQSAATDVYEQLVTVSNFDASETVSNATSNPGEQMYVAPPPLGEVTSKIASKRPYLTLESTWAEYPSTIGYQWTASQQLAAGCGANSACTLSWSAYLSPGVSGASPGYRMPDLSALTGWKPELELAGGTQISGSVTAVTSTAGSSDFPTRPPASGTQRTAARTDYSVMP